MCIFDRFGDLYGVHFGSLLGTQNWSMNSLQCNGAFEWVPGAPFDVNGGPVGVSWPESWTLGRPFWGLSRSILCHLWTVFNLLWVFVLDQGSVE